MKNKRLLFYVSNGIGNLIMMTPSMKACHELGYDIYALVNGEWNRSDPLIDILNKSDFIKEVISYPQEPFCVNDFDAIPLFYTQEKSRARDLIEGCEKTMKFHAPKWSDTKEHESDYFMQLPIKLGFKGKKPSAYCPVDDSFRIDERKRISIGFSCLSESVWNKKRWGNDRWSSLITTIIRYYNDIEICLLGGKGEEANAEEIMQRVFCPTRNIRDYVGKISITQTAKIIKESNVIITIDSSLSHIGCGVGTHVVVIFGPTLLHKNKPLTSKLSILASDISCAPCQGTKMFTKCIRNKCMDPIGSGDVFNELRKSGVLWI